MKLVSGIAAALLGLLPLAASGPALAQAWPTAKPITMVVPFPPGPALDMVARLVGGKLSAAVGQTETQAGSRQCMQSWRPKTQSPCSTFSEKVMTV